MIPMKPMLLSIFSTALVAACWDASGVGGDGGAVGGDEDTDTDPTDDYSCDGSPQTPCETAVCNTVNQYDSALEECAAGNEPHCQMVSECWGPYWACVDDTCDPTEPAADTEQAEALLGCMDVLTDCLSGLAP